MPTRKPTAAEPKSRAPGRPRCEKAHCAILDAAHDALRDRGFAAMTMEGVAERAGVGKATVYRWWPDKSALAIDAFFARVSPRVTFPDTGSVRGDFARQIQSVVREFNGPAGRMLASIIAAMQMDESLATAFRGRWLKLRRAEGLQAILRGVRRGELPADVDSTFLFDTLYSPLYFRLLMGHASITQPFARRLVDMVFDAVVAPRPRRRRPRRSSAVSSNP